MNTNAPIVLLAVLLSISGCEPESDATGGVDVVEEVTQSQSGPDDPGDSPAGTPPGTASACPDTRFIGQVGPGDACPDPANGQPWTVTRLFEDPDNPQSQIPPALERFCLYEWAGQSPFPSSQGIAGLPGYQGGGPHDWMNRDCMVVGRQSGAGLAEAALDAVTDDHVAAFLASTERPAALPSATGTVRVAIVDSWPRENPAPGVEPGQSLHGLAMGQIVEQLVCEPLGGAGPECPVSLRRHLALNLEAPNVVNNVAGGYFGFQGRLAQAIREAVSSWQAEAAGEPLIINLSLGWDPIYNEGSPLDAPGLSQAVIAVRRAIEDARCAGAVVIAAAGNASTGTSPTTGPIMPAAWATVSAPAGCGTGGLVFAASGVDGRDDVLRNARPGANAEFAAPAFAVVSTLVDGMGSVRRTSPLTGSSVAAAVTSAAAATVWLYDPSQSADEVMATVWSSGEDLTTPADFCTGAGTCHSSHRVSICRAASAAGASPLMCAPIAGGAGANVGWSADASNAVASAGTTPFDGTDLTHVMTPTGCTDPVAIESALTSYPGNFGCPEQQLPNTVSLPFIDPQPGPDPCRACALLMAYSASSHLIYIAVDSSYRTTVYPEQLTVFDRAGNTLHGWNLARAQDSTGRALADGMTAGDIYAVELSTSGLSASSIASASIEWLDSPTSTRTTETSEVPVY